MSDYRMNAKCAAGTGTFLEATALKLGLTLAELDEQIVRPKYALTGLDCFKRFGPFFWCQNGFGFQ